MPVYWMIEKELVVRISDKGETHTYPGVYPGADPTLLDVFRDPEVDNPLDDPTYIGAEMYYVWAWSPSTNATTAPIKLLVSGNEQWWSLDEYDKDRLQPGRVDDKIIGTHIIETMGGTPV